MPDVDYLAVVVAAISAFVVSGIWYGVLGRRLASLHPAYAAPGPSQAATIAVEIARNLVVTAVTAGLIDQIGAVSLLDGLVLGAALWLGFPAVLLAGSVFHERVPPELAVIHAGDWLLKILAIAGIVAVMQ